jgi:hypothetical protein
MEEWDSQKEHSIVEVSRLLHGSTNWNNIDTLVDLSFESALQSPALIIGSYLCTHGVRESPSHVQQVRGLHGQHQKAVAATCRAWRCRSAFSVAA